MRLDLLLTLVELPLWVVQPAYLLLWELSFFDKGTVSTIENVGSVC